MINEIVILKNKVLFTIKYLFKKLIRSPLLLGWIIIGTIIETICNSYSGLISVLINLILLALFTIIIKIMTDNSTAKPILKLKHPRLELFTGMLFFIFLFIEAGTLWGQAKIPIISTEITTLVSNIREIVFKLCNIGIPVWILYKLYNVSTSVLLELIPIIILFVIWGYGFRKMGFIFNNLRLILVLLGVTIIVGLPSKMLFQEAFYKTIIAFFIQIFINALPEELIFRGYLLPRFEAVLKNPINALVVVSILFNMFHIPSHLSSGMSIYQALVMSFSIGYPSGLIWGYLYLKTRSIVPGVMWHASIAILGNIFI